MNKTTGKWIVLNCFVTQVLGEYPSYEEARAAADEFGRCSFPYELSAEEAEAFAAAA